MAVVVLAVVVRLAVFGWTYAHPVIADGGRPIGPGVVGGVDIEFYQRWRGEWFGGSPVDTRDRDVFRQMVAGPVVPAAIVVFDYRAGHTLPLAVAYLAASLLLALVWLLWLDTAGVRSGWLALFALLPHPLYYMICIGTEIPFSLCVAGFAIAYFHPRAASDRRITAVWVTSLVLAVLTRPNALSLVVFVLLDALVLRTTRGRRPPLAAREAVLVVGAVAGAVFLPYFVRLLTTTSVKTYFGWTAAEYLAGPFASLPHALNVAAGALGLLAAKLLYFVGLRPSYSGVAPLIVAVRAAPGLLLLAGLVGVAWRGTARLRLFVVCFVAPVLLVGAQDRYSLPIQPLLFYYAVMLLGSVGRRPSPPEVLA
jgi:hypothetical protein